MAIDSTSTTAPEATSGPICRALPETIRLRALRTSTIAVMRARYTRHPVTTPAITESEGAISTESKVSSLMLSNLVTATALVSRLHMARCSPLQWTYPKPSPIPNTFSLLFLSKLQRDLVTSSHKYMIPLSAMSTDVNM